MIDVFLLLLAALMLAVYRWWIQRRIVGLALLLGGSRALGIYVYSLVFLPGVMVHELSHFFAAILLGVRTGEIALLPRLFEEDDDGRVALGSVQVAKTDFLRGSLIGAAPFFVGIALLYAVVVVGFSPLAEALSQNGFDQTFFDLLVAQFRLPLTYFWLYAVLALANTLFPSKEDARAWPVLGGLLILLIIAIRLGGGSSKLTVLLMPKFVLLARALVGSFVLAAFVNAIFVGFLYVCEKLAERISGRRIVS